MKRFLVLLAVVAALVAAAAFDVPSQAVSINGVGISQQSVDADLSTIAGSAAYQCYAKAGLTLDGETVGKLFPVTGAGGKTTYNTTFVRYWLTEMLSDELVAQVAAARHLTVTPADLSLGRTSLRDQVTEVLDDYENDTGASCGTSGAALLASLPASFRDEQIRAQTEREVLLAHEAGYGLGPASLHRFYTVHRAEFDTECISYVGFSSESTAATAAASIAAGTPVAQTGTLTEIGCGIQEAIEQSGTAIPKSVISQPVGKASAPVSEGTGTAKYALLVVTSRKVTAFATARSAVEEALLSAGSTRTNSLLEAANKRAVVTADPRYGRVRPGTVAFAAPASPATSFVLDPSANLPSRGATVSSDSTSTSG